MANAFYFVSRLYQPMC